MIDITRPLKTRGGKRVVGLVFGGKNGCGRSVTYPIRGTVIEREKPLKCTYEIWSKDGVWDVVWGRRPERDLIYAD